jgi:hypothetical protein
MSGGGSPAPAAGGSLAEIERCGADVNNWLASRGYDRAVAKGLIASFVGAEYPPNEWVSSLDGMSPDDIKALVGAVQTEALASAPDPNGVEALPGETDAQYAARQVRAAFGVGLASVTAR